MFNIVFYESKNGVSELWDFIEDLRIKSEKDKNSRIQYRQIRLYIQLLAENGTRINTNVTKYIGDDIWELRPGDNRIFYFCFTGKTIVLLHCFRKKSRKTPTAEIEKAKAARNDFLARYGGLKDEDLE